VAPLRDAPVAAQIAYRDTTLALTCVASLCRLPQVSIPAGTVDGLPIGLSLLAAPHRDAELLALVEALA
jgi:amidase